MCVLSCGAVVRCCRAFLFCRRVVLSCHFVLFFRYCRVVCVLSCISAVPSCGAVVCVGRFCCAVVSFVLSRSAGAVVHFCCAVVSCGECVVHFCCAVVPFRVCAVVRFCCVMLFCAVMSFRAFVSCCAVLCCRDICMLLLMYCCSDMCGCQKRPFLWPFLLKDFTKIPAFGPCPHNEFKPQHANFGIQLLSSNPEFLGFPVTNLGLFLCPPRAPTTQARCPRD